MEDTQQGKRLTSMEDLNDDLVYEILCRIPYKYLMQCKCVCKRWLLLISNPDPNVVARRRLLFTKKAQAWSFMHYSNKSNKVMYSSIDSVFQSPGFSLSFLPCYDPNKTKSIHILQTFDDLVLCSEDKNYQTVYYVCNPLTMQWVALPPVLRSRRCCVDFTCESYEDQKQHEGVATCRFKVLRVHLSLAAISLEIFSSEIGGWTSTQVFLSSDIRIFRLTTVTCKDTLYLLSKDLIVLNLNSLINNDHHHYQLVQFPSVQLPKEGWFRFRTMIAMAYQGRLRVISLVVFDEAPVLYIWELKEDYRVKGDEWNLVHRVSFAEMVTDSSEWFSEVAVPPRDRKHQVRRFLNFHPVEENVVYLLLHGRMASYDMWNKSLSFHPETRLSKSLVPPCQLVLPLRPTTIPQV